MRRRNRCSPKHQTSHPHRPTSSSDRRIRDCSSEFPENRRIAEQHAWMWSLFPARRRNKQPRPTTTAAEEPAQKSAAVSESSLSALLASMPPPPLHRQSSVVDKASYDHHNKHRNEKSCPPVPLEISFPFSCSSSSDDSETSFDPSTLILGDLAVACDQVQLETLAWEDDSSASALPDDTGREDTAALETWESQHHYDMPDTFHNSTTTHDSTWGMTTTTLEDTTRTRNSSISCLVEKQRAATWSGGNCWERSPTKSIAEDDRPRRVHFAA